MTRQLIRWFQRPKIFASGLPHQSHSAAQCLAPGSPKHWCYWCHFLDSGMLFNKWVNYMVICDFPWLSMVIYGFILSINTIYTLSTSLPIKVWWEVYIREHPIPIASRLGMKHTKVPNTAQKCQILQELRNKQTLGHVGSCSRWEHAAWHLARRFDPHQDPRCAHTDLRGYPVGASSHRTIPRLLTTHRLIRVFTDYMEGVVPDIIYVYTV